MTVRLRIRGRFYKYMSFWLPSLYTYGFFDQNLVLFVFEVENWQISILENENDQNTSE